MCLFRRHPAITGLLLFEVFPKHQQQQHCGMLNVDRVLFFLEIECLQLIYSAGTYLILSTLLTLAASLVDVYACVELNQTIHVVRLLLFIPGGHRGHRLPPPDYLYPLLATLATISICFDVIIIVMVLVKHRLPLEMVRIITASVMQRSAVTATVRVLNLFFYYQVERNFHYEIIVVMIHVAFVLVAFNFWTRTHAHREAEDDLHADWIRTSTPQYHQLSYEATEDEETAV